MRKKYFLLTALVLASAIVVAGVQRMFSLPEGSEGSSSNDTAEETQTVVRKWDFTKWSETTVANLINGSDWSDMENASQTEPTAESQENCFWEVTSRGTSSGAVMTANGEIIEELQGLLFTHTKHRALAIAVNYQVTSLGTYQGGSYLWLGSSNVVWFKIPKVAKGSIIKMGVESHKPSDARGVKLYIGSSSGTELLSPEGQTVNVPTTYTEQTWIVPDDATDTANEDGTFDIVVRNTNGCHLYFIEVASQISAEDVISAARTELENAIERTNTFLQSNRISEKGKRLLQAAIASAQAALEGGDADEINTAKTALEETMELVRTNYVLPTETITFSINNYKYYYDTDTIYGDHVKLAFSQNSANNTPYNNYGTFYFYNRNSMKLKADQPMVDVVVNMVSGYNYQLTASTGSMTGTNHWTGDTSELTFTNNSGNIIRFSSITITYYNPTIEELIDNLQDQIAATDDALASLAYPEVPGSAELSALADAMRQEELTEESEPAYVKNLTKQLEDMTATVVSLDGEYQEVAGMMATLQQTAASNEMVDPMVVEAANAYIEEVNAGMTEGAYSSEDLQTVRSLLTDYTTQLSVVSLVLHIEEAGVLGDSVLKHVENFSNVVGLRVSGHLNSTDMNNLKSRLTNVEYLDLEETDVTAIPNNQFKDRTNLKKLRLPKTLETIGDYAFSGCQNLSDVEFPTSLRTIGAYAFQMCYTFESVVVPEGVTTINEYAFAQDENSYRSYRDEQGNYRTEYLGNIKSVSLPSTLRTLGYNAFQYDRKLTTVTIADGLTTISGAAFYYCSSLQDLRLPATLESIGSSAFYYCSSLQSLELPEGVTTLDYNAFANCTNLQKAVLPGTLLSVSSPFDECANLKQMTLKAMVPPSIRSDVMGGAEAQCTLTVPNLSINVYKQTNYWDQFNIVGDDILPQDIVVTKAFKLDWPENVDIAYKPNINLIESYTYYNSWSSSYTRGSLEVTGKGTLSAGNYEMFYNFYDQYNNSGNTAVYFTTLLNKGSMRSDEISMNITMYGGRWNFIVLPFDVAVADIVADDHGAFVIRKYDGQKRANGEMDATWVDVTGDEILHAGQGYVWNAATYSVKSGNTTTTYYDRRFKVSALQTVNKNNLFANDNVEVPLDEHLAEFSQNRSWNLVGNPYPCYFDIRAIDTTTPITVWDGYNRNYKAYSPQDDSYILTPGEAFFIQRPVDQESIEFLKEGRQADRSVRNVSYFSNARQSEQGAKRSVFNLTLKNGEQTDHTRFVVNAGAQTAYETACDAAKFMGEGAIDLFTIEQGQRMAINERPLADGRIALGVRFAQQGSYTLALLTEERQEVYLIDQLTGTEVLLGEQGYTFQSEAGTIENRFVLRFGSGTVTGIQTAEKAMPAADATYYNLRGMRIEQPQKGIYIRNGKKIVTK